MPLYDYQCQSCGQVFEVMQKFSDEPLKVHESCGGTLDRLISAPALQFKGSGWYITDYARSGGGDKNGKSEGKSSGDSGSTESKAKPAESSPAGATTTTKTKKD